METKKTLSGYEITYEDGRIISLIKDGKSVKFPYKFYENHEDELDFENIKDFVKEEQDRKESDRVSVNLANGKVNTNETAKLLEGASLILLSINGAVDFDKIKRIIRIAKDKAIANDATIKELRAKVHTLKGMYATMVEVFGQADKACQEAYAKIESAEKDVSDREQELLKA